MRRTAHSAARPEMLSFNATPMVDVIFMLTIFFMLVTRFSSAEQIPMDLPRPEKSMARVPRGGDRVIVNCRLADPENPANSAVLYSVGPNQPEPLTVIGDQLAALKQGTPGLQVVVRADRRLPYSQVRQVMRVIAARGIEMFNVVVHVSDDD